MPSFRGVDQQDVYHSIHWTYVHMDRLHHYDSAVRQALRQISFREDAYDALLEARTDAELAAAVTATNAQLVFALLDPLLEYHRLNNTDGKMRALVDTIDKWGGRDAALALPDTLIKRELQSLARRKSRLWINCQKAFGKLPQRQPALLPSPAAHPKAPI